MQIWHLLIILSLSLSAFQGFAQDDAEFIEEPMMDEEMDPEEIQPMDSLEPVPGNEPEPITQKPNRFNRETKPSRFRAKNSSKSFNSNSRFSRSSSKSSSGSGTVTQPVLVAKNDSDKKSKMSFADAQPEDIHNENFPDLVESFDYKDAPLADIVDAMAKLTGKNMIIEPGISGKITITAPNKVTIAEAWEAFLSALAMNNFTIVPSGKFLKVRKMDAAKTDSIETYSGPFYPDGDQLITRIIRLKHISAADFQKTFDRALKSKIGQLIAYEKTNSLIITDLGSNIARMSRIIKDLDKPGYEEQLAVIPIKNAKSKDLAEIIEKIINKGESGGKRRSFRPSSRFGKKAKDESLSLVSPDERTNSLIVVGNAKGVSRIRKLVSQLDYPLDTAESGLFHVYYVKHGDAKKIEEAIMGIAEESEKKASSSGSSKGGSNSKFTPPVQKKSMFGGDVIIKADENNNSLIIAAKPQDYTVILELLQKMDLPKDQVFVKAYIVEMAATGGRDWEAGLLQFFGARDTNSSENGDGGISRAGYTFGGLAGLADIQQRGSIFTFGSDQMVDVNIGGTTIPVPNLLGFINLLQSKTDANVLSTPQILAMDNEESVIEVGDEVPVGLATNATAAGGALGTTPTFKDATIMLKIKPFISPDSDVVRMEIEQQVNDVSTREIKAEQLAQVSQGLTKRKIKTNLSLRSGETAVLGGLMKDSDTITERKIPLLGDIPVLGWLFKQRNVSRAKSNLLVFLTPNIIRNSADHKKLTREKMNERIDWVKQNGNGRDPFGASLSQLAKYVDNEDEFDLEDQVVNPAPVLDAPVDSDLDSDYEDELEDQLDDDVEFE